MSNDEATMAAPPPVPRRRRRWPRALLGSALLLVALLVALLGGAYAFLGTQAALNYVVQRAITEGEGHLAIEGAEGSLLSTVRVSRITWQGDEVDVEARDMALAWSPWDLVSRRFIVHGLGAKYLAFDIKKSSSTPTGLPTSLALPLEVDIRNIGVQRLEWKTGEGSGFVTGVTFGYAGGATVHAVRELRFVTVNGTLSGAAQVAATAPFALTGKLAFEGDAAFRAGQATLAVDGTLERIGIDAQGSFRNAAVNAKATLTPFAAAFLVAAAIDARDVDLAQFLPAMPATTLTLKLAARPEGAGFAGTLSARNEAAGPLDAGRVPVTALTSRFAWDGNVLSLSAVDAQFDGGGRATGSATIPVDGGPVGLDLALADVDLARLQTTLLATRLSGTLAAAVTQDRQVVRGDLRQGDLGLAFAATIAQRQLTLERIRAQSGGGELTGSGTLEFDGARAFTVKARAARFNPARFVAMPDAELSGTIDARGTLAPQWNVTANVALDKGSRFAGVDVAGTAKAQVTPGTARDVAVNLRAGTATIAVTGAYGTAADTLAFNVDLPRVAELRPLLARYAKVAVPEPFAGALRARGTLSGLVGSQGFSVDVHGEGLQWGNAIRVATLDANASAAPGSGAAGAVPLEARPVSLTLAATRVVAAPGELATVRANVTGSLAQHRATLSATGDAIDLTTALAGGLVTTRRTDGAVESAWKGSVEALANRGAYAFNLDAPATLVLARDRVEIGAARMKVADGRADLASLAIVDGRISTTGSFTGIPVAALARFSGTALPFPSTMAIGGEWSLAASPRLNGTVLIRRESGDWYASESTTLDPADLALGITVLELSARFADDALTANARFRSARAGTADANATLAAGTVPGRVATDTPLAATVTADLASLKPLQPWLGTLAVMDGRAHVALAARGTLAQPILTGTLDGDALRFDLPQYGVHLKDGRLRARLAERTLTLDEFSFAGGNGRFAAKGTLARAGTEKTSADAAAARVEWQATDFTIVNRPDLLLVADGKGTLAFENGKLALAGSINIDQGRIAYERTSVGTLSDDVVIVGQPRKDAAGASMRDLPLALDVEVTLGRDFRFTGEGLDTRLAGRVRVVTALNGSLTAKGTIRAVAGTYIVFGQRLDIDRGRLLFDGPVDNPALDVVALRKNLAVEAGVELSGTVKVPRVRLVSNPPVPDGEKLAWLLTGQGLDRANRADLAALSAASASLLGQGKKPITTQIANTVGLDDISVRESPSSVVGGTSGQVVAFGKRISDRLSLVYEQGLTVATNALRIEYALSRTLTLRAEAGTVSSAGIYYRRSYD
ncbi:MAG: translocation/assembly module TamB domain-containing protein [Betaproteobacteria bacterium]